MIGRTCSAHPPLPIARPPRPRTTPGSTPGIAPAPPFAHVAVFVFLLVFFLFAIAAPAAPTVPPFSGTIFINPEILRASDPTAFVSITAAGRGVRVMFDRRVNDWVTLEAFLFDARYDDGLRIEVQVNPEFGDPDAALSEARRYATVIGQLPTSLRANVATTWIHQGRQPFGGGNNNLLIHTGQADEYAASGILEETLVHEASHTSLDPAHAAAPAWIAAQQSDPVFISEYARDNPTREDVAESFLPYLALRHRADRIPASLTDSIQSAIPHRIAYFDSLPLRLHPMVRPSLAVQAVEREVITLAWTRPGVADWQLQRSTSLENPAWIPVLDPAVNDGPKRTVRLPVAAEPRYFRLARLP